MAEAYPLAWPEGWPRTPSHKRRDGTHFKSTYTPYPAGDPYGTRTRTITLDRARKLLFDELGRLRAVNVVFSSNLPLRMDGLPRADAERKSIDPGVAIYFTWKGKQMTMACDSFQLIAANTRSLGLAIEAMRQLERHGGGHMMERAFEGFAQLPPPEGAAPRRPWWEVLNYSKDPEERKWLSADEVNVRFRKMAKDLHPDKADGDAAAMAELNGARDDAVAELEGKESEAAE